MLKYVYVHITSVVYPTALIHISNSDHEIDSSERHPCMPPVNFERVQQQNKRVCCRHTSKPKVIRQLDYTA
jgi:hypothetical protein